MKKWIRNWLGIKKNENDLIEVRLDSVIMKKTLARVDARSRTQDDDIINIMDRQQRIEKDYPLTYEELEDK